MDQLHTFPSPSLNYGKTTTSILHEVKNSWQNDKLRSLQEEFRKKVRSDIAEDDCKKSMNALLRIGDLRKKGVYKGLTREMSFEEMSACVNLELSNLSPEFGSKQPDMSMSLEEMQQWLDKEFEIPRELKIPKEKNKSILKKTVSQSDKIEELLIEKIPNATIKPELEDGQTSSPGASHKNSEMNVNQYADQRSLFPLQKYVGSCKKPASITGEECPCVLEPAVLGAMLLPDTPLVPEPTASNVPSDVQRQEKSDGTSAHRLPGEQQPTLQRTSSATAGDGVCAHATSQPPPAELPPDEPFGPTRVWLQKERRACTHRRCEACVVKEYASDTEEGYPRTHSPRPGLNRELFKNDAMPQQLSADMTFLGPYYARMLSKYMSANQSRGLLLTDGATSKLSNMLPHIIASASQKTLRAKASDSCTNERSRSRSSLDRGEKVNERKKSNDTTSSKKFPMINNGISVRNSLLSNGYVGLNKDVPCNSRATSKSVISMRNMLKPRLSSSTNRNVPCSSRCTSKTIMSTPSRIQNSHLTLRVSQESPPFSTQPLRNVTEKVTTDAERIPKEPRAISNSPRASKTNCSVLKSRLRPRIFKSIPPLQPALDRPTGRQNGGSCGENTGGDRCGRHVTDAETKGGGGGGGGEGGGNTRVNHQMSATELVRQWLTDSPQRPNEEYARRNVKKLQKKDVAAFSKAQKSAELERIYGRRMDSVQTSRPPSRPHTHPASKQRRRPEWNMY